MTPIMDAASKSVNPECYTRKCQAGKVSDMEGRAARIRWILKERGWSQRELSRRAGFRTESQIGNILRNLDEDDDAIVAGTLRQIAHGAGVSERWLYTGEGSPTDTAGIDDVAVPDVDAAPSSSSGSAPSTFGGFPGYAQTERLARVLDPAIPEVIWTATRDSNPLWLGRNAPTPQVLVDVARLIMKHAPPNTKK